MGSDKGNSAATPAVPDDFTGQIMLAQIQAENLNDLGGAQQIIQRIALRKVTAPLSDLRTRMQTCGLADQILARPGFGARSPGRNSQSFSGNRNAHVAAQRIAHLASREHLRKRKTDFDSSAQGDEDIGLTMRRSSATADDRPARAAEYVKHLELHPLDCDVRENWL